MKTGDKVTITYQGRTVQGSIRLASRNEKSLMLEFETILGSFAGLMPVMMDEHGAYVDLVYKEPVEISITH